MAAHRVNRWPISVSDRGGLPFALETGMRASMIGLGAGNIIRRTYAWR
jgi:hypothetical protein